MQRQSDILWPSGRRLNYTIHDDYDTEQRIVKHTKKGGLSDCYSYTIHIHRSELGSNPR